MIRRPPRSTPLYSSAASDVYKRQAAGSVDSATFASVGVLWRSTDGLKHSTEFLCTAFCVRQIRQFPILRVGAVVGKCGSICSLLLRHHVSQVNQAFSVIRNYHRHLVVTDHCCHCGGRIRLNYLRIFTRTARQNNNRSFLHACRRRFVRNFLGDDSILCSSRLP